MESTQMIHGHEAFLRGDGGRYACPTNQWNVTNDR